MDYKMELCKRIRFVVFGDDCWRVGIHYDNGVPEISLDVHGLTVPEAKRIIRNVINVSRESILHLNIIHGYHHGTAIKSMLEAESFAGRVSERFCPDENPGQTIMTIAA